MKTSRAPAAARFRMGLLMGLLLTTLPGLPARAAVTATESDFHGRKAIVLRNRVAEVVVVPEIGRVMRFDLHGEGETGPAPSSRGPFWNHPRIGSGLAPDAEGWTNHGGDKAWPAPQSDWPKVTGRPWPPPKGFDATPYEVRSPIRQGRQGRQGRQDQQGRIEMTSAVDPDYGIRVRRVITLHPRDPSMTIETTYEKLRGAPVRVAVWTITQLDAPDRLFVLLPARRGRAFPDGYLSLLPDAPAAPRIEGRLLSMARDPRHKTMISSDGRALLWVGRALDLLIEDMSIALVGKPGGPRATDDESARSQIYTSPDGSLTGAIPPYVELELLGRPRVLHAGAKATMRARYVLIRRTEPDPWNEAKKVWPRWRKR